MSRKNFGIFITVHISTEFYLFINISRHMILLYLSSIIWNKINTAKILLQNNQFILIFFPEFSKWHPYDYNNLWFMIIQFSDSTKFDINFDK